jgi:hypothetical protein
MGGAFAPQKYPSSDLRDSAGEIMDSMAQSACGVGWKEYDPGFGAHLSRLSLPKKASSTRFG